MMIFRILVMLQLENYIDKIAFLHLMCDDLSVFIDGVYRNFRIFPSSVVSPPYNCSCLTGQKPALFKFCILVGHSYVGLKIPGQAGDDCLVIAGQAGDDSI